MRSNYIPVLLLLAMSSFMTSCTSRYDDSTPTPANVIDTIFPMSYFPAYPGSHWTYVDTANNDTVTSYTDPGWYLDSYSITYPAQQIYSDTFYTPRFTDDLDNYHAPIWGYQAHGASVSNAGSNTMHRMVSDSLPVGSHWVNMAYTFYWTDRKIIAVNQTVVIGAVSYSPTIVVEEYNSIQPPFQWRVRRYFTKDVGIVREEIYNIIDSTTATRDLVDYYINN